MRVIRWRNASTGVESLTITSTGVYFPVGKTDSGFKLKLSMSSGGQTASVETVRDANGTRTGQGSLSVSGTTETKLGAIVSLATGIIVNAISGTLNAILDDETAITSWPDSLGRFPAVEDATAYVYGSTPPVGLLATCAGNTVVWRGAAVGWVPSMWTGESVVGIARVSQKPVIGSLTGGSLGSVPLGVNSDGSISCSLGPSSYTTDASEFSAAISGKTEVRFSDNSKVINTETLKRSGIAFANLDVVSDYVQIGTHKTKSSFIVGQASPLFEVSGKGTFIFVYMTSGNNNYVNDIKSSARVLVNGQRLSGSDSSACFTLTPSGTGGGYRKYWVSLTFGNVGDYSVEIDISYNNRGNNYLYGIYYSKTLTVSTAQNYSSALICGDSFAARRAAVSVTAGTPYEIPKTFRAMAASAVSLLGYRTYDCAEGGTGFMQQNASIGNFREMLRQYVDPDSSRLVQPSSFSLVYLHGTNNDGTLYSQNAYFDVISYAALNFPNAAIVVTSVYEGFNTPATVKPLNDALHAAVLQAQQIYGTSRIIFIPVDSAYTLDGVGVYSGTGSVPAPTGDGNADIFISSIAQTAADRHQNADGVLHGAQFYARAMIRGGVPYVQ